MKKKWQRCFHFLLYTCAGILIFLAVVFTATRALSPLVNSHRAVFERLATRLLHNPVKVGHISLGWRGLEPEIILNDVAIYRAHAVNDTKPLLQAKHFYVQLDLMASLWHRQFRPSMITVSGAHLIVKRMDPTTYEINSLSTWHTGTKGLSNQKLRNWFFSEGRVGLTDIQLDFYNQKGVMYPFMIQQLDFVNDDDKHQLSGDVLLQDNNASFHFILQAQGKVTSLAELSAQLYIEGKNVDMTRWLKHRDYAGYELIHGFGHARVWLNWDRGHWRNQSADLRLYGLEFKSKVNASTFLLKGLTGKFAFRPSTTGWKFSATHVAIIDQDNIWPETNLTFQTDELTGQPIKQSVQLTYVNLKTAIRFLQGSNVLPEKMRVMLQKLAFSGDVKNLSYATQGGWVKPLHYQVSVEFKHLAFSDWQYFPGLSELNGQVSANEKAGKATLFGENGVLYFNRLFHQPIPLKETKGMIVWDKQVSGWKINLQSLSASNTDMHLNTQGTLQFLSKKSLPDVNLTAHFMLKDPHRIPFYLPTKGVSLQAAQWLDQAFLSGKPVSAGMVLRGNLADFPFDHSADGKFRVDANVEDINIRYAPDWPILKNLQGKLVFFGRSMVVNLTSGSTLTAKIDHAKVIIPVIQKDKPLDLKISGEMTDQGQGLFNFVQATPLKSSVGEALKPFQLKGVVGLKLKLMIPLAKPNDTSVWGDIHLSDNKFKLMSFGEGIEHLKGNIIFTKESLSSASLTGLLLGQPLQAKIKTTESDKKMPVVKIQFHMPLLVEDLKKTFPALQSVAFSGKAKVNGVLSFGLNEKSKKQNILKLHSSLQGVGVAYPVPFMKAVNNSKPFSISFHFGNAQPTKFFVHYSDVLHAAGLLKEDEKSHTVHLYGLNINLGEVVAGVPRQPGIFLTGELSAFDWRDWQPFFAKIENANRKTVKVKGSQFQDVKKLFRVANLHINQLKAFGFDFQPATINVRRGHTSWLFTLITRPVEGTLTYPDDFPATILSAHFSHLFLPDFTNKKAILDVKPEEVPAFSVYINDLRYAGKPLGSLDLRVSPGRHELTIQELRLDSPFVEANLQGAWINLQNQKTKTQLSGVISSYNLKGLFDAWHFQSSLVAKIAEMKLNLTWPGAPQDFKLVDAIGNINFSVKNGWIIDLSESTTQKLNAGRLLTLLSIQHFMFHIKDLSKQGYSFNTLAGNFFLRDGIIGTQNLEAKGVVADIKAKGIVNIIAKTLDLKLAIIVNATSSLPVIATIASGFNPIVGIATWVADKMVHKAMSKTAHYGYEVMGSWHNPRVIHLK